MGRLMGFEPMHIGTTIRGLNRLTTGAMFPTYFSITNKDFFARAKKRRFLKASFLIFSLFAGTYIQCHVPSILIQDWLDLLPT